MPVLGEVPAGLAFFGAETRRYRVDFFEACHPGFCWELPCLGEVHGVVEVWDFEEFAAAFGLCALEHRAVELVEAFVVEV